MFNAKGVLFFLNALSRVMAFPSHPVVFFFSWLTFLQWQDVMTSQWIACHSPPTRQFHTWRVRSQPDASQIGCVILWSHFVLLGRSSDSKNYFLTTIVFFALSVPGFLWSSSTFSRLLRKIEHLEHPVNEKLGTDVDLVEEVLRCVGAQRVLVHGPTEREGK